MPTYFFIKNSSNLYQIEGAMSKSRMEMLIKKYMESVVKEAPNNSFDINDFSQENLDEIWDSSSKLNSIAWNAYENSNDMEVLLKAIERSIELDKNYYNLDTHAALLYKIEDYKKALKRAKEAVDFAKINGIEYVTTTELIEKM